MAGFKANHIARNPKFLFADVESKLFFESLKDTDFVGHFMHVRTESKTTKWGSDSFGHLLPRVY